MFLLLKYSKFSVYRSHTAWLSWSDCMARSDLARVSGDQESAGRSHWVWLFSEWWVSYITCLWFFHVFLGKWSNLTCAYFWDALVQPPTSFWDLRKVFKDPCEQTAEVIPSFGNEETYSNMGKPENHRLKSVKRGYVSSQKSYSTQRFLRISDSMSSLYTMLTHWNHRQFLGP